MSLDDLIIFLENEKNKLLKAREYIISFYKQIIECLETLVDNYFTFSFAASGTWQNMIDRNNLIFSAQDFEIEAILINSEINTNILISIINNTYAVINKYLLEPNIIELFDTDIILKFNSIILKYLNKLYAQDNLSIMDKKQVEFAFAVKKTIEDRINNNIKPFFLRLQLIISDGYRVTMREPIKSIVSTFTNYRKDPAKYDRLIKEKCKSMGIKNNIELNINIIADLTKDEYIFESEIKVKYQDPEKIRKTTKIYRLKQIAFRYVSQAENIDALGYFFLEILTRFQLYNFIRRLINFIMRFLTGKEINPESRDIIFEYTVKHGKIKRKKTSLKKLTKKIDLFKGYLLKAKENIEFYSYTKITNPNSIHELENIIDRCLEEMNEIYEQSDGFREWLGERKNNKLLKAIPVRKQEEFNNLLLAINHVLIINKHNIYNLEGFQL